MSNDNFHSLDTEELDQEQLELDMASVKAKTDFLTVSGNINLDTVQSNQTTFINQLSGASSSGLKTQIDSNDTDITGINDKLDATSSSGLKNLIDVNTAKVSFPGFGTTANKCLPGNTVIPSSSQINQISLNENAIDAVELKTDFITVTQNVNLDTMENDITTNNAKVGITTQQANDITANNAKVGITTQQANDITANNAKVGITTQQANDITANNAKVGITTAEQNKLSNINVTQSVNLDNIESDVSGLKDLIEVNSSHTRVKTTTNNRIEFYEGSTELFNSDEVKNLVDNITVSSSVNLNTMNNNITTNQNNINQAGINSNNQLTTINGIKNNTLASTLKTAVDANSNKVSMVLGTNSNEALAGDTAIITTAERNKLSNLNLNSSVMSFATGTLGNVIGTSGFSIQNSNLNSGALNDSFAGFKQSNTGKTIINGTTTDPISFRKNNVEEYTSNELKNLVDNISVTQAVNLDTMESNIATNNAKNSYPSVDATKMNNISVTQAVNLDTMESNIATNNAKIGFPSTLNNLLSVSDTYELEVGNGQGIPRIRLNGQNGVTNSSEIIFIDATGNNPEYFQGFTIRYNSSANILQIGSDQNNNNSPNECLRIDRSSRETQLHKACVYLNEIEAKGASNVSPANANLMLTTKLGSLPGYSSNYYPTVKTSFSNMYFAVGGNYVAYLTSSNVGQIDFTGQHRAVPANNNLITNLQNNIGKIVSSTGEICSLIEDENGIFQPQNTITINESIPKVELSNSYKCKKVFGVISDGTDTENQGEKHYKMGAFTSVIHSLEDDNRLTINSVGEGAILVCNTQGNIENGDLITTSTLEGIGCKQDDDIVHNYTVAKATIDCNFDLNSNNYNCYLDENNNKIAFISCIYLL